MQLRNTSAAVLAFMMLAGTPAAAQDPGDPAKGLAYAQQVCAECHGVGREDKASPNASAPTFGAVANTPAMTGTALAVWLDSPHPSMPQILVPTGIRNDLIEYILSLKTKR